MINWRRETVKLTGVLAIAILFGTIQATVGWKLTADACATYAYLMIINRIW
jgi:hypothetical protein